MATPPNRSNRNCQPPVFDTLREAWDYAVRNHPNDGKMFTVAVRQTEVTKEELASLLGSLPKRRAP